MIGLNTAIKKINNKEYVKFSDIESLLLIENIDKELRLKLINYILYERKITGLFRKDILSADERIYVIENCTLIRKNLFLGLNSLLFNDELTKEEAVMFYKQELRQNRAKSLNLNLYFQKLIKDGKIEKLKYFIKNIEDYNAIAFYSQSIMYYFQKNVYSFNQDYYEQVCKQFELEGFKIPDTMKAKLEHAYLNVLFWYAIHKRNFGQIIQYEVELINNFCEVQKCIYETYKDEMIKYALKSQSRSIDCLKIYGNLLNEESKCKLFEQILKSKRDIKRFSVFATNKPLNIEEFYHRVVDVFCGWTIYISDEQMARVNAKEIFATLIK